MKIERIRIFRECAGLKQSDMADKLDITQASYSRWESGETDIPISKIIRLCELLDTNPNELVDWWAL